MGGLGQPEPLSDSKVGAGKVVDRLQLADDITRVGTRDGSNGDGPERIAGLDDHRGCVRRRCGAACTCATQAECRIDRDGHEDERERPPAPGEPKLGGHGT
jgi:hypothetical protein